jgi:hypothetical protein
MSLFEKKGDEMKKFRQFHPEIEALEKELKKYNRIKKGVKAGSLGLAAILGGKGLDSLF